MSKQHCRIYLEKEQHQEHIAQKGYEPTNWHIEDIGSTNGTKIIRKGKLIDVLRNTEAQLNNKDQIIIGETILTITEI